MLRIGKSHICTRSQSCKNAKDFLGVFAICAESKLSLEHGQHFIDDFINLAQFYCLIECD
jgi:hypothetical protein